MGPGNLYVGKLEHAELGSLEWSLSEYPIGGPETAFYEFGEHTLVENFDYGLTHVPEQDEPPEDWKGLGHFDQRFFELGEKDLQTLRSDQQQEYLVNWFGQHYEDPAQNMPYDGREGGFQYTNGGPFNATDELSFYFGKFLNDTTIEMAVDVIERDGTYEWTARDNGAESENEEDFDYAPDAIDPFEDAINQNQILNFGTPEEIKAREPIIEQLNELQAAIEEEMAPIIHGGIGHNHPPLEPEVVAKYQELNPELQALLEEIDKEKPDASVLLKTGKFLRNWLRSGLIKANDEAFKTIGKLSGAGVVSGVAGAGAYIAVQVSDKAAGLYDSFINWVSLLV